MRKAFAILPILLAVALTVTGCDFFRRLAGRPTSVDIEAMREVIKSREEARQAAEAASPDSLPKADTVSPAAPAAGSSAVKEQDKVVDSAPASADGKKRYYVIVASFSKVENAGKCAERMENRGYPSELLKFKGGYTAVGICGTDDEQEAKESLKELKRQDFCPQGVWILDRNKK